jgi:hypothetical protein
MSEPSNVVRGILHPDGTLELAERPTLPAGEVEVTIRPATSEAPKETLWEAMQRSRAELEASGYGFFRTKEEIDAYIEDLRDWDGKVDEVYRQLEEERRRVGPQ